jgi:transcriptional regulator with XRE-family HTH domain
MVKKKKALMTKSEFARETGVTKGRISQLIRDGTLQERKDGRLDFDKSIRRIKTHRDPSRPSKIIPENEEGEVADGFRRARTAKEVFKAKLTELEYKKETSASVDVKEIKGGIFELYRTLRDTFQNIPDRLAPVFAGETDIEKIRLMMKKEIDRANEDFWKGVETILGAKPISQFDFMGGPGRV